MVIRVNGSSGLNDGLWVSDGVCRFHKIEKIRTAEQNIKMLKNK